MVWCYVKPIIEGWAGGGPLKYIRISFRLSVSSVCRKSVISELQTSVEFVGK